AQPTLHILRVVRQQAGDDRPRAHIVEWRPDQPVGAERTKRVARATAVAREQSGAATGIGRRGVTRHADQDRGDNDQPRHGGTAISAIRSKIAATKKPNPARPPHPARNLARPSTRIAISTRPETAFARR